MAKLFVNSGDPDQMPCSVASDLGLHCLPITLLWVSRLQWVKGCHADYIKMPHSLLIVSHSDYLIQVADKKLLT